MFSLQKLLGKDDQFFALLEASAEEGRSSVQALKRVLTNPSVTPTLDEFVASRRKDKAITTEISELLCRTFVTTLEREDIEALSTVLYKIPKTAEKFAERYIMTAPQTRDVDFSRQVAMLEQATDVVAAMVKSLRKAPSVVKLAELNGRLQQIEGDADKLMLELLRTLYGTEQNALKAVILKDLYELLEKIVDRARDAGNVIYHVILKYS